MFLAVGIYCFLSCWRNVFCKARLMLGSKVINSHTPGITKVDDDMAAISLVPMLSTGAYTSTVERPGE